MADSCSMVGCNSLGTKSCGACGVASYCSVECQKGDWKVHKYSCVNMNKLPTAFLSLSEKIVAQRNILRSQRKHKETITLLQRYLAFTERQYGVQVEGTSYWRRSNGDKVDNKVLITIRINIAGMCHTVGEDDSALAHAIEARQMLEHRDRSDNTTLRHLARAETLISFVYLKKQQFDVAEHHSEQSLMFARLVNGEGRITSEYEALDLFTIIRQRQSRYPEAIEFAEQSYILVSEAYGPVHPQVQAAAAQLIQSLISNGDYSRADDYCRMNLENLTDPSNGIDHNCDQVAEAMMQIANIWLYKAPVDDKTAAFAFAEKAEDMARKSCNIDHAVYSGKVRYYEVFGDVLRKRGKYTDETRMALEQALSLHRQLKSPTYATLVTECLRRLIDFHDHMSEIMPPGDARDRELQLRDGYAKEMLN